jgi:hypothetical protein
MKEWIGEKVVDRGMKEGMDECKGGLINEDVD